MINNAVRAWTGILVLAMVFGISGTANASTVTVATWLDPWVSEEVSGARPFSFTDTGTNLDGGGQLTASDDSILLDLPILGLTGLDASYVITNASDSPLNTTSQTDVPFDPLNPTGPGYVSATFEAGKVVIKSDAIQGDFNVGDVLLTIEFQSAIAVLGNVIAIDDFTGMNVVFSGLALGTLIVESEQFSFSTANVTNSSALLKPADMEDWDASASFTSSATVVPVPATVWLFGSGLLGLVGIARRKKA